MGQRVRCRGHCLGPTHAVKLLIAMAVMGIGATVAAPSAACRRLAALIEQEEQAEQQRRAAELQAERDKAAEARRAAEKQGIDTRSGGNQQVHRGQIYGVVLLLCTLYRNAPIMYRY